MSCFSGSPCYSNGTVVYPRGCGIDPCYAHKTGTDLVFYNGANLPCVGVDTCDSVTLSFQKIDQKLCPEALALSVLGAITNNLSIQNMFCTLVNACLPTTTTTTTIAPTTTTTTTIAPTTTTTTTTAPCPCNLYEFGVPKLGSGTISYVPCGESSEVIEVAADFLQIICVEGGTTPTTTGDAFLINLNTCCSLTTTTTTTAL